MSGWWGRLFGRTPPPHECLFLVVRAVPHDQVHRTGSPFSTSDGGTYTVPGTNLLMRCTCGKWVVQWLPGTWTTSDFDRTKPVDMDRALDALTKGEGR